MKAEIEAERRKQELIEREKNRRIKALGKTTAKYLIKKNDKKKSKK